MATVKTVEVRLTTEGYEDAKLKIDKLAVASEELSREHPEIKPQIDSAKVLLEARLLRDGIKKELSGSVMEGAGGSGGGGGSILGTLTGGGGNGLMGVATSPVGIAAIATAAGALLVELTGLVAGLAAAGAGAVAFGALAYPAFEDVKNALGDTRAQLAKLSPDERGAVLAIRDLKTEFEKMSTAFEPTVFKVFNDGLQAAKNLLPTLKTPATDFGNALDGLLKQFDKFTQSKGFQTWLASFDKLIGPATTAIGRGLGDVATNIGKLLTTLSAKDVVNSLNIAFRAISGTITGLRLAVRGLMIAWDAVQHAFDNTSHAAANVIHAFDNVMHAIGNFDHAIDNARHGVDVFFSDAAHVFDSINQTINRWASNVGHAIGTAVTWFRGLPGRILSAVGNLGGLLVSAGHSVIDGLIAGVKSAVPGLQSALSWVTSLIPSWKGPLDRDKLLLYPNGKAIMGGLIKGIGDTVPALHSQLSGITGSIGGAAGVSGAGRRNYTIVLNQLVADKNTGRLVVQAIKQFEQGSGASWRV